MKIEINDIKCLPCKFWERTHILGRCHNPHLIYFDDIYDDEIDPKNLYHYTSSNGNFKSQIETGGEFGCKYYEEVKCL
jgi:hypothetical protein